MISIINSKIFIPFLTTSKEKIKRNFSPAARRKLIFKKIFQLYYQPIFRLCWQAARSRETAENITVQIFAQLYKELSKLDRNVSFGEHLRRIAVSRLSEFQLNQRQFEN